jgi:hypothetical protein
MELPSFLIFRYFSSAFFFDTAKISFNSYLKKTWLKFPSKSYSRIEAKVFSQIHRFWLNYINSKNISF